MMRINEASEKLRISDADGQTRLGGQKYRATCILAMPLFDNAYCLCAEPCGPVQSNKAQDNEAPLYRNDLQSQDLTRFSVLGISSVSKPIL